MRTFLIVSMLFAGFSAFAQTEGEEVFEMFDVNQRAMFKGGDDSLMYFLANEIKYPPLALEKDIQGKVILKFVVNTKGEVEQIEVINKPIGYGIEEEAIRVLKSTNGLWEPAMALDKPVATRMVLPLNFELR